MAIDRALGIWCRSKPSPVAVWPWPGTKALGSCAVCAFLSSCTAWPSPSILEQVIFYSIYNEWYVGPEFISHIYLVKYVWSFCDQGYLPDLANSPLVPLCPLRGRIRTSERRIRILCLGLLWIKRLFVKRCMLMSLLKIPLFRVRVNQEFVCWMKISLVSIVCIQLHMDFFSPIWRPDHNE